MNTQGNYTTNELFTCPCIGNLTIHVQDPNQNRKNTNDMHHWFCHTISVCAKWHKILIQGHKFQARYVQKVVSFENENRTQFYQMNKNCYHNRIILKPMPEHSKGANRTQRSYSKLFMDRVPSKNWWLYDQLKSTVFQVSGMCNIY